MHYKEYKPSKELADSIECYWVLKCPGDSVAKKELVVPGGRVEVMINTGTVPVSFISSSGKRFELKNNIYVLGQRNTFFTTFFQPGYNAWGIRFKPACFYSFCNSPASYLLNELVEAAEVLTTINTDDWYYKFIDKENDHRKIEVIETFLKRILYSGEISNCGFAQTLSLARNDYQGTSIHEFCTQNRMYYKKLERQFLQYAGYTPKEFFNVRRFYNALRLIYNTSRSLTDICHHLGYYDQSHFIRDFKSYTSLPPSKFIKDGYQIPRMTAASDFV